jgi:hypothetical protein
MWLVVNGPQAWCFVGESQSVVGGDGVDIISLPTSAWASLHSLRSQASYRFDGKASRGKSFTHMYLTAISRTGFGRLGGLQCSLIRPCVLFHLSLCPDGEVVKNRRGQVAEEIHD